MAHAWHRKLAQRPRKLHILQTTSNRSESKGPSPDIDESLGLGTRLVISTCIDLDFSQGAAWPAVHCPIERLPVELITDLFCLVLDWPNRGHSPSSLRIPLVLASVSKRWRKIALSTPMLWSRIHVAPRPDQLGSASRRLEAQLTRSSPMPFDLSIDLIYLRRGDDIHALWWLAAPHLERCKRLDLDGVRKAASTILFPLPLFESMKEISLSAQLPHNLEPAFDIHNAPSHMKSVRLTHILPTDIPMQSIDSLYLSFGADVPRKIADIVDLLRRWPGAADLRVLELDNVTLADHTNTATSDPLSLPALTSLRAPDGPLHRYLSMPRLRTLSCDDFGTSWSPLHVHFSNVEHLTILGNHTIAKASLAQLSLLKTLVISRCHSPCRWFKVLHEITDVVNTTGSGATSSTTESVDAQSFKYAPSLKLLRILHYPFHFKENHGLVMSSLCQLLDRRPQLLVELPHEALSHIELRDHITNDDARSRVTEGTGSPG